MDHFAGNTPAETLMCVCQLAAGRKRERESAAGNYVSIMQKMSTEVVICILSRCALTTNQYLT